MREGLLCLSAVGEAGGRALSGLLVLSGQVLTTRLYMYVYTIYCVTPQSGGIGEQCRSHITGRH